MGASESSRFSSLGSETSSGKTRFPHFLQMKRKRKRKRNYSVDHRLNQDNAIKIRGKVQNINIVYNGERSSGSCLCIRRKKEKEFCKHIDEYIPPTDGHFSSWNSSDEDQSLQSLSQQTTFIDGSDKIFTKSSQRTGEKGEKGDKGKSVIGRGSGGLNGTSGENGQKGEMGLQRPPGLNGTKGDMGIQGPPGLNGTKGDQGIQGPPGMNGTKGDQGIQGPPGLNGTKGNMGIQGPPGLNGTKGNMGIQGPPGLNGTKGNIGIQGPPGLNGTKGNMGQGPPGLNGTKGNMGIQGPPGMNGTKGDLGIQGPPGLNGTKGDQGIQGPPGMNGTKGDQGIQGPSGLNGTKGEKDERHSKRCSIFSFPGTCLFNVEKLMPSVCNIELNGLTLGTGFRIGRRFVMTAYHVLEFCIDDFRLPWYCKASFPSSGVFSFANIEFVDKQKDVLILSLQCPDDKTLPAPLTVSEESEDSDRAVYITQNPSTASGRSGSPGIVLDKDGRPVVTVMHIESRFKSKTAMLHHIRHPIVCHRNWFVKISHRDYNGHYSSMTMKRLAHLFQDYREGALKEKCFGDLYDDSDKSTEIFCERYCYEDTFMMVVGSAGCGKSSFIKTLTDSWKPADNDNHYPDIIVFAFAASDSDALPTDEIERVLSQYKQHGLHIYGVMTKMDLVTEDDITKTKKNQIISLLGLKEDSFSYWINKVPSNEKVNAADNVNPVVVRIESDMEKLKEVLKKHCTTKGAEEFESEEAFKDVRKLSQDLPFLEKLDPSDFKEDQDNFTGDHGWQVTQELQQTSTNSTFSTCACEYPAYNGMEREKILPDGENNDIRLMQQQIENRELVVTQVKSSDVRHIQPVLQTGNSSKDLTSEDSNTMSTNQRNSTVGYCTPVYTEQSKSPGTMSTSVSNIALDISQTCGSTDKKCNLLQAEYTPKTDTLNMLVDRKLNGPESMPYVSKQQEHSLILEGDKDENLSAVIDLKKLKFEPRKGTSEIFCDRKPDVEMICNEFFNIKMKEDCDFVSVHPEEEIQASSSEIIVEDNIGLETDEITSDDDNKMINSTETEEVQTHLKELNYVAGKKDFSHSREFPERLRRLMNIRQDFTSIKWTKFHVNPAPRDTRPSNLFGSQEQSSNTITSAHTEENENHTSDPTIPHGLDRREQITSGMTGSSVSTPCSQETRQHHYQTQSSDSSMLSSGNTGIPDSFSRNTSSMNGLLSSPRSGSQEEVLRYEWGRFRTFWSYPLDCPVNPTNLARHGWFYEGNDDETVCFSCKVKHAHWRMGEDIDAIHAQISPHCPFINGQESGNVPIHGNPTPIVPANSNQGAVGGASYVNENSTSSNTWVDHEPTSLLTRNLQLGGEDQNTASSFVQQSTGSAQIATRTPATAQQKSTLNRNYGASTPSTSTACGTAAGNVAANNARLIASPTSPSIFLQTSEPSRPSVTQTPGSAPIRTEFQPQPQTNSQNSQPPSNQQHPTTPRQIKEKRQRQSQVLPNISVPFAAKPKFPKDKNENHTSDPWVPDGLYRREQITSGMTGSSNSTPCSQETRQHHHQTQSSDSSMLSSGNTGIPDSFSRNTSSVNGLLSSPRSGSQEEVLRYEWGRFRTFWSYPPDCPVNPTNLARRGWFYEGNDDETVCFSCKVRHAHWRMGEDIDAIHAQISPHCPFINGQESGNVPIHGNLTTSMPANSNQGAVGTSTNALTVSYRQPINSQVYLDQENIARQWTEERPRQLQRSEEDIMHMRSYKDTLCQSCDRIFRTWMLLPCRHCICDNCRDSLLNSPECPICFENVAEFDIL